MSEFFPPNVRVDEVSIGSRPIAGVRTSTAGFVGQTERGPVQPRLVTSWEDYTRWYGTYVDQVPGHTAMKYLPYAVRGFFDNGGQQLVIARVVPNGSAAASFPSTEGEVPIRITAIGPGGWGNRIRVRIMDASLAVSDAPTSNWFRLTLLYYANEVPEQFVDPTDPLQLGNPNRREPEAIEDYDNLSILPTDDNFGQSIVNRASKLVTITLTSKPDDVEFSSVTLSGGSNGDGEPTTADYLVSSNAPAGSGTGLAGLAGMPDISLVAIPDEVVLPDLRVGVLEQCRTLRDRFAVLSATDDEQNNIQSRRPPQDSPDGAYYLPWVRVLAPHTPEGHLLVPPTGHIIGIYTRVDIERGVHNAPANEEIRGLVTQDLSGDNKPLKHVLSRQEQDLLSPNSVNVIRDFRSVRRGIRVWGARTMSSDPQWKYVNVRRLFIFVQQSIERGTQWVVFEPNNEETWGEVRLHIAAFLRTVWRDGALAGVTQKDAFFVKCDRSTMTQENIDNGQLICLVGIAPVKPAEFVIFRVLHKTLAAE